MTEPDDHLCRDMRESSIIDEAHHAWSVMDDVALEMRMQWSTRDPSPAEIEVLRVGVNQLAQLFRTVFAP